MESLNSITATYGTRTEAICAVEELLAEGCSKNDISLLLPESSNRKSFYVRTGTKATKGLGIGAILGGILGAAAIGFTMVGTLIPIGISSSIASGAAIAAFAGGGMGAAMGGVLGAMIGLGAVEHEAKLVDLDPGTGGNVLLAIDAARDKKRMVEFILSRTGATHISIQ
ncbi:MAG: hypothetical protein AB7T49_07650 [Oligoflexales bacterium]